MWHENVLGTIGETPLVRLNAIPRGLPCTVLAKVEFFNPGGSVKDRIGLAMIEDAERKGLLKPGGTIVEGTSGNTGAGLAIAAIAKGYRCVFTTTDKQSPEKMDVLRALGAEVVVCPTAVAPDDPRSYYSVAARIADETPGAFYPNQYDHPANAEAHYRTSGPELWRQTDGRITHYFAGAGTGGTISGTTRYLKEHNPDLLTVGVDPYGSAYHTYFHTGEFIDAEVHSYVTEGVGEDILAGNMDFALVDDFVRVTDRESMQMTRRLAQEEGLFVGQSCGMAVAGMMRWLEAHRDALSEDDVVVVLLPDSGFRYLSKTYNDAWMRRHGYLAPEGDAPALTAADVLDAQEQSDAPPTVAADATLAEAVRAMRASGAGLVVLRDGDRIAGCLSEGEALDLLVEDPAARDRAASEAVGSALPIVQDDVGAEGLAAMLDAAPAVLVRRTDGGDALAPPEYGLITRADLAAALAGATEPALAR